MNKIIFLIILFVCIQVQAGAKEKGITLSARQVNLKTILADIETQAAVTFSYESSLLEGLPLITFSCKKETLKGCLDSLFINLPLIFRQTENFIILKKKPKQYTISGFVTDISKETLLNASVYDTQSTQGVTTNSYGFYSLTLHPGTVNLTCSYVGYKPFNNEFTLSGDTIIHIMLEGQPSLNEIVVEGKNPKTEVLNSRMSRLELTSSDIKSTPTLFGEADLVKTLQLLPGVSAGTEGLAGMYVRGGNNDENLFLIDGNPVYQINHLGGIFSAFNPEAVKSMDFYKGSFPSRYGGRLSSVVDVRTKDGNMKEFHGSASIGLIAANLSLEGPIIKGRTSFNIAVRRTYLDVFTAPAFAIINKKNKSGDKINFRYAFHDINAKINHKFSDRSRLYLSLYSGEDVLKYKFEEWNIRDDHKQLGSRDKASLNWGNLISSLTWNYVFNNKLFGNMSLVYSKYRSKISYDNGNINEENELPQEGSHAIRSHSSIEDIGYRMDFDYIPSPIHHFRFGSDYLFHMFRPEYYSKKTVLTDDKTSEIVDKIYSDQRLHANEFSLFGEDDITLSSRLQANIGLRFSLFNIGQKTYSSLQPRASVRYLMGKDWSVKASYSRMSQYVHLISSTYLSLPTDNWAPVTENIKPMLSDQVSAGAYYRLNRTFNFSIEGYYKTMNNILENKDGSALMPSFSQWDQKIVSGKGRSYGVEFMARKVTGRTTGWIGYGLTWANRQFKEINRGNRYPAKFDNRHKVNIVIAHKLSKRVDINLSWMYATGNRVTIALEQYDGAQPPGTEYPGGNSPFDYVKERNNVKLADYHRLDLGLNIYRPKKNGRMGIWNISIYNVYNRLNPFMIHKKSVYDESGEFPNGKTVFQQIGILPIIPSISYTYKF